MNFLILLVLLVTVCESSAHAENWPQFRGPKMNGQAAGGFPTEWNVEKNVRWTYASSGEGWSAPIVWGDDLFMTAAEMTAAPPKAEEAEAEDDDSGRRRRRDGYNLSNATYDWKVICLNAETGEVKWQKTARSGQPTLPRHETNSYATETPVTDGKHIWAYFGMNGLFCYSVSGDLIWEKELGSYEMRAGWGTASSPVLHDGKLILQIDNEQQSFVTALDAKTGEVIWRTNQDEPSQYSTPFIWENSQRSEIITCGQTTRSYDPATGELLWQLDMQKGRSSATPIASGDILYVGNELRNRGGSDDGGGFFFAIKAGGAGDISPAEGETTNESILWSVPKAGLQMASPVLCAGHLYLLERRAGVLHCLNAQTGEFAYKTRIPQAQAFWSSPWAAGDEVYCLDDDGTTHVIQGGPEFDVLRTNRIDEQFWSTPAIANGALYLRGAKNLYCIGD